MPTRFSPTALARLQAAFVAIVLPKVLSHDRVYFATSNANIGRKTSSRT